MVQAQDLRIGNWIEYEGKYYRVHSPCLEFPILDTIEYGIGATDWKNAKGIELTPSILEQCGFEKEFDVYSKQGFEIANITDGNGKKSFILLRNGEAASVDFYYLHQLQNLFWCLVGSELNYKPIK